jgi:succinate dehydrogenase/fumarate reductase-like Fe-S protein
MDVRTPSPNDVSAIDVRVFRFDPQTGAAPHYASYSVPSATALTALEVLDHIYAHLDRRLAYRTYYCLKGVCLACLVRIDGKGAKGCERLLVPGGTYTIGGCKGT